MDILQLRTKLDSHEISAVELTRKYLDSISNLDKRINAFLYVNYDKAMISAENAQKRIDRSESMPLTGIPIALKDNLCTIDMPTTCASKMLEGYLPPYDATVVELLRKQDAIFLGKVNMDEFAMGASTKNSSYFPTHNPFNEKCVPGGSSGGSAAAVSAEMCVIALGTDTGGSIRQPASFCGVTGHRPTYGLVSRYGCVAFASSLDQIGPIGQSAQDCAIALKAISGFDHHDQTSVKSRPLEVAFGKSIKGKKLGLIAELMGNEIDSEVIQCVEKAANRYRSAGAIVEVVSLPMLTYAVPAYYIISSAEASTNLSRFDGVRYGHRTENPTDFNDLISRSRSEGFGWEVKRRIMLGSYALCSGYYDDYYKKALQLVNTIRCQYKEAFNQYDALLSPVSPTVAFEFDKIPSDPAQMYLADICTVSASLAGLPSLSTPCGYTKDGMPIGLMITGKQWDDDFVLALADVFEKEFEHRKPEVSM